MTCHDRVNNNNITSAGHDISVITVYRGIITLVTGLIITILTYIKMSHFQI